MCHSAGLSDCDLVSTVLSTKFIIIIPLNAKWDIGHQQVFSIPVGPLQDIKPAPSYVLGSKGLPLLCQFEEVIII